MQIALPEPNISATLILDPENPPSDEQFIAFCEANRDLQIERSSRGEILIVPPAGGESDFRNVGVTFQLEGWSQKSRTGVTFGPTSLFSLSDGSAFSPDAAWVSRDRLSALTREQLRGFMPVCPEFVIEVMSPSDRLRAAQKKMRTWIENGATLGWLIDADAMQVYVYRPSGEVQIVTGNHIDGEGLVKGFRLKLTAIWRGLFWLLTRSCRPFPEPSVAQPCTKRPPETEACSKSRR